MNWFLMALSAILGGVATWFWSVRKVHRKVPVYEAGAGPKPAAAAPLADVSSLDEPADAASGAVSTDASTEEVSTEEPSAESVDAEDDAETSLAVQAAAFAGGSSDSATASKKRAPKVTVAEAGATGAALTASDDLDSPALPGVDVPVAAGGNPHGWTIKGNAGSGLYHTVKSPYYKRTKAEAWFETEADAEAAGFVRWDRREKKAAEPAAVVTVPDGPYGPGSAAAGPDGSGPDGWTVKGNADSGLYHAQASPYYSRTKAEVWFQTEEAAAAAGFARWDSRRKKKA